MNITVTTTATAIQVAFNDYASALGISKGTWAKSGIMKVEQHADHCHLVFKYNRDNWEVCHSSSLRIGAHKIDTIDGVPMNDNDALYSALSALV